MIMGDMTPDQILTMMSSSPDLEGPYVLGCFGKMVTFYSQQRRALNLIWALSEKGMLGSSVDLAIVGGGLAGLTAAAAAASKGRDVTLFERNDEILHVQRTNGSRYVHPHLNSWPDESAEDIATDLPFLNWYSGRTSDVCKQIEDEWRLFERRDGEDAGPVKRVVVHRQHDVTEVKKIEGGFLMCWQDRQGGGFGQKIFHRVIFAVGFGLERMMQPIPFHSYWEDDSLHQGMSLPGR
jgi:FAD dependent oxidoreductase